MILILFSCKSSKYLSNSNLSYLYSDKENTPVIQYTVFHNSDSTTTLYYSIDPASLLYVKPFFSETFSAKYKITYQLFKSYDSAGIIDSCSFIKTDSSNHQLNNLIFDSIIFKARFPGFYVLKVNLTDINRKKETENFININKKNRFNSQNFLVKTSDGLPIREKYISSNTEIKIVCRDSSLKFLYGKYFKNNFSIAVPPYVNYASEPTIFNVDSIFNLKIINNQTNYFKLTSEGIYHFQIDSTKQDGLTLFRFYEDFPKVTTPEQMFYSLRYITSKKEYEKIYFLKEKKLGIDEFWLDIAGNAERALTLVQKYYTRIEEANRFFTSYQEGWKTDRGMIYIIYGPPNSINRSDPVEVWAYGQPGNTTSINFKFAKFKNPFTDYDYKLERSAIYKSSWYNALDTWRR